MATIAINRLANRVVEVIRDGAPEYFTGVANVFIKNRTTRDGVAYIDVVFKTVVGDNKTIQFLYPDITTINGVAKPTLAVDGAKLLATDVFSIGGGDATSGVTQAQVDSSISAALSGYLTSSAASSTYLTQTSAATTYLTQANATSTYKRKDQFIETSTSVDFPSIAAQTMSSGITVSNAATTGIAGGDKLIMGVSTNRNTALIIYATTGTNSITFWAYNTSLSAVDNIAGTYKTTVVKDNSYS